MTKAASTPAPSAILCADWGKDARKRTVYVADVGGRSVRRVSAGRGWSFREVLDEAERWTPTGAVLATFDVPLGVPVRYLAAARALRSASPPTTFVDLLARVGAMPRFFDATADARDWSVERPFFAVPAGAGGLRSYIEAAARQGVDLYRHIDRDTGAKSVFIRSGIPGSVGSAACALWQELAPYVGERRGFGVWPFEGDLETLLRSASVVVGEIYPRAAYATALLDVPPASRAPLVLAKTDARVRAAALAALRAARWVASLDVTLEHLAEAEANEDDFDACLTAAALLRCVLDGSPLCPADLDLAASEGSILGTGSVNLRLPHRDFKALARRRGRPHRLRSA
jgi:hypothetical protein